ncbi:MAG: CvpA family protein [Rhizobiaceae bacterium]|jgi:membrane protein required for colicin V production|nr:CvpA family protein [Rhizobiaceae bacterium]
MPIELLDIILIVLMLISGLLAMVRGFSREILSISSWVIAGIAAFSFYKLLSPYAAEYTRSFTNNEKVPDIVAGAAIFLVALILVSLITMKIADFIVDSRVGALDRTLGFIFGAARGALLVMVLLLFYLNFFPDNQYSWIANAKSKPALEAMGESLVNMIPDDPAGYVFEKLGIESEPAPEGQNT